MGQCKRCGGVYGVNDMTEGICKNCIKPEGMTVYKEGDIDNMLGDYKFAISINLSIMALMLLVVITMYAGFAADLLWGFSLVLIPLLLLIGNIVSITVIFKLLKKKEQNHRMAYLVTSLAIPDGIILFILWSLKDANFHA